jgi:hypothetical protein
LGLSLRAIATVNRHRGLSEEEHEHVIEWLQRRYRRVAGLRDVGDSTASVSCDGFDGCWADDDESDGPCICCGGQRVHATMQTNRWRLAVCASCACRELLDLSFRAIAKHKRQRGAPEEEHKSVIDELAWRYRYPAGTDAGIRFLRGLANRWRGQDGR